MCAHARAPRQTGPVRLRPRSVNSASRAIGGFSAYAAGARASRQGGRSQTSEPTASRLTDWIGHTLSVRLGSSRARARSAGLLVFGHVRAEVDLLLDALRPAVVRELDDRVQRDREARRVHPVDAHQVGVEHAQHRLVRDDQDRLVVALELVDERVEPGDDVEVRLAACAAGVGGGASSG